MGTEREVKLAFPHESFFSKLRDLNLRFDVLESYLEEDLYFDTADCRLMLADKVLRLRISGSKIKITYKGPRITSGGEKVREEIEGPLGSEECSKALRTVGVSFDCPRDLDSLLSQLDQSGYEEKVRVIKRRKQIDIEDFRDHKVTLDFIEGLGEFVEVEGPDPMSLVRLLGLECYVVTPSYAELVRLIKLRTDT